MDHNKDYYKILNIPQNATPNQIKRSYLALALKFHPDRVPADQKEKAEKIFKDIAEAYFILGNKQRRALYDQQKGIHANENRTKPQDAPLQTRDFSDDELFEEFLKAQKGFVDWSEIFGGTYAKIIAVTIVILYFLIPQIDFKNFFGLWADRFAFILLSAVCYIVIKPLRKFFMLWWQYGFAESMVLILSWFFILLPALLLIVSIFLKSQ